MVADARPGFIRRAGQWVREFLSPVTRPVSEMIGRYVMAVSHTLYAVKTVDETTPDYAFWDSFRRGKAKGYSLGSLFARRIERIFARWVFGSGFEVTLAQDAEMPYAEEAESYTNQRLATFMDGLLNAGGNNGEIGDRDDGATSLLMQLYEDHLGLGDQFVIVNADGSLSVPSPDTVKVTRDELDYRQVLAVEIETRTSGRTIVDRYEPDRRTVTVKKGNQVISEETYSNLIGVIPVVHLAHGRSGNETNGHSIHEPLLPLCDQYDDVLYKQLDGAKLLGNPIPVFEGMENIDSVLNANAPAEQDTYTDKDGTTATRTQITIDQHAVLLVGKGGSFKFAAPPTGFSSDTTQSLKSLFLLILDHTGIPEFIWGNELSSARASAEVQMTQWVHDIVGLQRVSGGWVLRLAALWLRMAALTDPRLIVGRLGLTWAPLVEEDRTLRLEEIRFANDANLLTGETALRLLDLVEDPEGEAKAAQEESKQRREELFPEGDSFGFRGDLNTADADAQEDQEA